MVAEFVNRRWTFTSSRSIATSWQQYNNCNCAAIAICIWIRSIHCIRALYIWTMHARYAWCICCAHNVCLWTHTGIVCGLFHNEYTCFLYVTSTHPSRSSYVVTVCSLFVYYILQYGHCQFGKLCIYIGLHRTFHNKHKCPTAHYAHIVTVIGWYRQPVLAPSIFGANQFGRWVVTHSLADFNFHDHRPAVRMNQHPLWYPISEQFSALSNH